MRSSYIFTRSQVESSFLVNTDSTRRDAILPPPEVTRQLRDLFLLLDPKGTGTVSREDVLSSLFGLPEWDVLTPWKTPPWEAQGWNGAARDERQEASVARSGVCIGPSASPSRLDFFGLLQLCSSCLGSLPATPTVCVLCGEGYYGNGGREERPSSGVRTTTTTTAAASARHSPLCRLRRATRSVRVDLSDAAVLKVARVFRSLDEGEKGFLDVLDVARGLVVLTSDTLQRRQRRLSPSGRHPPGKRPSPRELPAALARMTRARLWGRRDEHAIFLDMAEKMLLSAILGLEEAEDSVGRAQEAPPIGGAAPSASVSGASDAAASLCGSNTSSSAVALQRRYARIDEAQQAQEVALVVSLPVFIRSYQCGTGAFPPEFMHFAGPSDAAEEADEGRDAPEADVRGNVDKESAPQPTKKDATLSGLLGLCRAPADTKTASSGRGTSVLSGRRSMSGGGGGPPITAVTPFELTMLTHLLTRYADELCGAPREGGGTCTVTVVEPTKDVAVEREEAAPFCTASPAPDNTTHTHAVRAANGGGGNEHQPAAVVSLHKDASQALLVGGPVRPTNLSPTAAMPAGERGAAEHGPPLTPVPELEQRLLLDLDSLYAGLEEVRWVQVQRVCEVARRHAVDFDKEREVVNLDVVLECLACDPASLGLTIAPHEERLSACLEVVSQSLPRSVLSLVVELMVELGLHKAPDTQRRRDRARHNGDDDDDEGTESLKAVAALQRRLPGILASCLDVCDVVCGGLTRLFTSCAEPCVAAARGRSSGPSASDKATSPVFLSLESLFERLLSGYHCAAPPPQVPRRQARALESYQCRRLSSQEMKSLFDAALSFLNTESLLSPGAEEPCASYAEQPQLFRALAAHLVRSCPLLCRTRPFVAESVAARVLRALPAVYQHQVDWASLSASQGEDHVTAGWETPYLRHLVFPPAPESGADDDDADDVRSLFAWSEFAAGRVFCAVGPEGCQQISLALCRLPLWRPPASATAATTSTRDGKVLVKEESLIGALSATLLRLRPDWAAASPGPLNDDGGEGCLHHVLWDAVGVCPLHPTAQTRATVVDMAYLLQHFLELFPVVSASPRSSSHLLFDIYCRMSDVQSIYFALKRLIAGGHPNSATADSSGGPPSGHCPRRPVKKGPGHAGGGSPRLLTSSALFAPTPATTSRDALATPQNSGQGDGGRQPLPPLCPHPHLSSSSSSSRVRPIPFDRLKAILEADGLLFVLCLLGSQDAITGEVTQLSHVLKALSLTEDRVCVLLSRLSRSPLPSKAARGRGRWRPPELAPEAEGGIGATLRAKALALAMPCQLQHAAVQLFFRGCEDARTASVDGGNAALLGTGEEPVLDRYRLGSFVFRLMGRRLREEKREDEVVAFMNQLFVQGGGGPADGAPAREGSGSLGGTPRAMTLEEFLTAVCRERNAAVLRRLQGNPGDRSQSASARPCVLDVWCTLLSPLLGSQVIE